MNDIRNPNAIDNVLSRYFRAEMPQPWPQCPATIARPLPPARSGFRSAGRLILAASIVLFFLGYFSLAGLFTRPQVSTLTPGHEIGKTPDHGPKVKPMPR